MFYLFKYRKHQALEALETKESTSMILELSTRGSKEVHRKKKKPNIINLSFLIFYLNVETNILPNLNFSFLYKFTTGCWKWIGVFRKFSIITTMIVLLALLATPLSSHAAVTAINVGAQTGSVTYGAAGSVTFTISFTRTGNSPSISGLSVSSGLLGLASDSWSATSSSGNGNHEAPSVTLTITTLSTTPAGSYTFTVSSTNPALSKTGTLTVNAAALTVTASAQSKNYGATAPTSGTLNTNFTVSGLQNSDAVGGVTLGYSGSPTGNLVTATVGSYTITPSAVTFSSGVATNYSISNVVGTLTVNAAALSITANNLSKCFGVAYAFLGNEFTSAGLINGNTISSVSLISAGSGAGAAVGSYSIVPSSALGTGLSNYSITYNNGTLTIPENTITAPSVTTFCATSSGSDITIVGSDLGPGATYQWQINTNANDLDNTWSYSNISGATSKDYNPGTITTTTGYRRVSSTCSSISNIVKMFVIPGISGNTISPRVPLNNCGSITDYYIDGSYPSGGNNNTFTFQWQSSTDGVNFSNIPITAQGFDPGTIISPIYFRRIAYSGCCTSYSNVLFYNTQSATISGTLTVNAGSTTQLTGSPGGGTWSSATPSVATVNSSTGLVSGVSAGTSIITYTTAGGCSGTATVTVNLASTTPTVTSFSPTSACSGSGTSVVITGTNFTGATAVNFNGLSAASCTINSSILITATLPAGATTGPISVTTPSGTGTSSSNFTVNALPVGAPATISICSGEYTNYPPEINPDNSTITWTLGTITGEVSGASANSTPTNIINQQLTIPSYNTQGSVDYHVTPTSDQGCGGSEFIITVTVEHPAIGSFE